MMGTTKWWQRVAAAGCAIGAALTLAVAGAGSASATVDENMVSNNEPNFNGSIAGMNATQVYSLRIPDSNNSLVEVRGALGSNDQNGGIVDTWQAVNGFNYTYGSVLQPNELWEFIPEPANTGGTLNSGYGFLRSRQSGKCLQVMGAATADASLVNQWDCGAGFTNELWSLKNGGLQVKHSGAYLGFNAPTCQGWNSNGNGNTLYARTNVPPCTPIQAQKENYRFVTNKVNDIPLLSTVKDNASYECMNGYSKWTKSSLSKKGISLSVLLPSGSGEDIGYFYENLSTYHTAPVNAAGGGLVYAHNDLWDINAPFYQTGQIAIVCAP